MGQGNRSTGVQGGNRHNRNYSAAVPTPRRSTRNIGTSPVSLSISCSRNSADLLNFSYTASEKSLTVDLSQPHRQAADLQDKTLVIDGIHCIPAVREYLPYDLFLK